eukprot:11207530-Lingulodinium_polyedra.AAC.1
MLPAASSWRTIGVSAMLAQLCCLRVLRRDAPWSERRLSGIPDPDRHATQPVTARTRGGNDRER